MVSSYLVLNKLRLIDTVWAVILPGAASTFPVFIGDTFLYGDTGNGYGGSGGGRSLTLPDFARFGIWGIRGSFRSSIGIPGILNATGAAGISEEPGPSGRCHYIWQISMLIMQGYRRLPSLDHADAASLIFLSGQPSEQGIISSGMKGLK